MVYLPESIVKELRRRTEIDGVKTRSLSSVVREIVMRGWKDYVNSVQSE